MWLLIGVIGLIIFGIALLLLEILVVPGLVMGVIGVIFIVCGVSFTYIEYGVAVGNYTAAGTVVVTILSIILALRSKAWKRFGLKEELTGKVNVFDSLGIKVGDIGVTVSALRPMGSVLIINEKIEAESRGDFIAANTPIEVVQILPNKIIVKPKN
ncbi:MAG: hypothetical protein HKN22_01830 [Bacteroidia bacterium]|nr:hypothetical protein [Bacteroidia bacterium]